jgi:hypothetical protein
MDFYRFSTTKWTICSLCFNKCRHFLIFFKKFNYTTGPWENYAFKEYQKFLAKLDGTSMTIINCRFVYVHHDSSSDELTSNSNTLGFGNRRREM